MRMLVTGFGYAIALLGMFSMLSVPVGHLLLGGAIAGVVIGIAAQQSLGNVFAAIVMLFARPFVVGDTIRIRSGVTGVLDVKVLGTGLTYVTVMSDDGILRVPNSIMLGAGIGQLRPGATPIPSPEPWAPPAPTSTPASSVPPSTTPAPETQPSGSPSAAGTASADTGLPPNTPTL
ncbi:MAG: mechanosensitive ion channel domain-containing protein [Acidimicrobiales bacterium]